MSAKLGIVPPATPTELTTALCVAIGLTNETLRMFVPTKNAAFAANEKVAEITKKTIGFAKIVVNHRLYPLTNKHTFHL